jgi:multicomponent Na+:H+ antiporter subunit C
VEILLKIVVGLCFSAGFYLVLQRSLLQLVLGFAVLGNAANLLIFVAAGITDAGAPVLHADGSSGAMADPLPQALVLTAIVISFGVIGFTLALTHRVHAAIGILDVDDLRSTDRLDPPPDSGSEGGA